MKENIRINKVRLIVYGIITAVLIASSIAGAILYKNGSGTVGSVRIKLIPISTAFNNLDSVIRNGHIESKCTGTEIVVSYINKEAKIDQEFVYEFKTEEGIDYITNTYSDANSEIGDFIATNMIEAIYKLNQGIGKVSDKYRITSFGATSLKDGAIYRNKEEIITVDLNIKTNIVENAVALNLETIQDSDYIHVDELSEMKSNLQRSRTFRIVKRDTILYVKEDDVYYEVFFQFSDKEIMYRSAGSVINILKPELYKKLNDGTGNLDFNIQSNEYRIIENVTFQETGIFDSTDHIHEFLIFK